MPSGFYDYHHVELDRVGRGKRVLQPPGGETSDIFGVMFNGSSTPNGSLNGSRRGSRSEDTQNRLFGPPQESPRKVKDHMRSSIFSTDEIDNTPKAPVTSVDTSPAGSEASAPASPVASSASSVASSVTGTPTPIRATPVCATPVRVRLPPGGKSSGIF